MRKVKDRKAMGRDGILNEVWKYGGEEVMEWGWKICNRMWRGMAADLEGRNDSTGSEERERRGGARL